MADTTADSVPAKTRAIIYCVLVFVLGIGGLVGVGGHPRSSWFYPFLIAIGVIGCVRILRRGDRPLDAGDDPPKSIEKAVFWSAVAFVGSGAVLYAYWNLLGRDKLSWAFVLVLSAMSSVNVFRNKRGHAYSIWPSIVIVVLFIAVLAVVEAMGRI